MSDKTVSLPEGLVFHHIGVAARRIEDELPVWALLGYEKEGGAFDDPNQGVRGQFITAAGQPRLELLENLPDSGTLDKLLRRGQKLYHMAYYTDDIEGSIAALREQFAQMLSPLKASPRFGKRVCFMLLPNMHMIELLER